MATRWEREWPKTLNLPRVWFAKTLQILSKYLTRIIQIVWEARRPEKKMNMKKSRKTTKITGFTAHNCYKMSKTKTPRRQSNHSWLKMDIKHTIHQSIAAWPKSTPLNRHCSNAAAPKASTNQQQTLPKGQNTTYTLHPKLPWTKSTSNSLKTSIW